MKVPSLYTLHSPGYRRTLLVRRLLAATLVLSALLSTITVRGDAVVTLTRDIPVGTILAAGDLTTVHAPRDLIPGAALHDPNAAVGKATVVSLTRGQMLTTASFTGEGLFQEADTMVPIRLADPAVTPLLQHGLIVDVVSTDGQVIATGAHVVVTSTDDPGTVLLALDEAAAHAVAAASLNGALTVVLSAQERDRGA
ncbi:MAG: SAF domain-containing protein [Corynebacterium sp.]|nr:SAF domain-containing protein [Corynebacterium sp.]